MVYEIKNNNLDFDLETVLSGILEEVFITPDEK